MTNDPYQLLRQPTSQQNQQEPQAEPQKMTYSNAQNNKSLLSKSDLFFMLYNAGIIKFNQLERATGVPASNIDETVMLNGVLYHTINSASYMWAGGYIAESKELMERYGYLHGIIPYKQALYALVEIDKSEIKVNGIVGNYEAITPDDLGISNRCWNGVSTEPNVSSYRFHL